MTDRTLSTDPVSIDDPYDGWERHDLQCECMRLRETLKLLYEAVECPPSKDQGKKLAEALGLTRLVFRI